MKISIIITSYNKNNYLEKCIKSCLSQNYKNLEIILYDNNSTDGSDLILNKYSSNIIIKKKEKISEYSAVNQIDLLKNAFSICTGEIICLLDADDYFEDDKLINLNKIFSKNTLNNVVFDTPKILSNKNFYKFNNKKKFSKYIWPAIFPTSSISVKREFLKTFFDNIRVGMYPLLEVDFRINCLARMIDHKFLIIEDGSTVYRKVPDGIMSNIKKFSYKWWKKRLEAHYFINDIYNKNKIIYKKNYDFYLTKIIVYLLNKIIK